MAGVSFYNLPAVNVFDPSYLSDLEAWFKADAGITTVSGAVSVWADQSGNGRDLSQSVALSRPAYGSVQLNGIDVLSFDGNNDSLLAASDSTFNFLHQGDSTVFVVVKISNTSNPDASAMLMGNSNGTLSSIGYSFFYDDRSSVSRNNNFGFFISNNTATPVINSNNNDKITPNTWTYIAAAVDIDAAAADRLDGYVDGVKFDATSTATGPPSGTNASRALAIASAGTIIFGLVDYAEIIMYSRKLSSTEIDQVEAYITSKWGL